MLRTTIIFLAMLLFSANLMAQKKKISSKEYKPIILQTNSEGQGIEFEIEFHQGAEFYYPLIAMWIEDMSGNYIQTIYVAQSIAKGVFVYGQVKDNRWEKESKRRPAALPYWGHKYGFKAEDGLYIPTPENPIADAYTGATPTTDFILQSKSDNELPQKFRILFEINQTWDWNEYWTNNKFPDDNEYKTSAQPALVYAADIDLRTIQKEFLMKPIGHSHYSGKTGELFTDLSALTTAMEIVDKIIVRIK
jgi:hypothetical protein